MSRLNLIAGAVVLLLGHNLTQAADEPAPPRPVSAKVGEEPIYADEVQAAAVQAVAGRPVAPEAQPALLAQALEHLVQQRLTFAFLAGQDDFKATEGEIDTAVRNLEAQLGRQKLTLDLFLAQRKLTRDALRKQFELQTRWNKYVDKQATDERLEAAFEARAADLDGREMKVSHILLRVGETPQTTKPETVLKKAAAIREEIEAKKISFADAAKKYSSGPSRENGGDLGFIPRRGVMVEPFSAAAFALAPGQISPPVTTPFGVHLIQCVEIKAGPKTWSDLKTELRLIVSQEIAAEIAAKEREKTAVEYSGVTPYILPGTKRLVLPGG